MAPRGKKGPLDHWIPNKERYYDGYVSRNFNGIRDLDLLAYAQQEQEPVLMAGPTGPGKTAAVMAYGAATQQPVVTVPCNGGIDPNSFWGTHEFDEDTQRIRRTMSEVTIGLQQKAIIYLDEVNYMPPKTAVAWHPALDARRFVVIMEWGNMKIDLHPECMIVATYNPDYHGGRPLNQAFVNRFHLKQIVDYDPEVEKELISMPILLEIAGKLRTAATDTGVIESPTSTNMLMEFERFALDLGLDFAIDNMIAAYSAAERAAVREVINNHRVQLDDQFDELERQVDSED